MISFLLERPGYLVHGRPDPHIEICNLVKEECLKEFHFSLNVAKITFVNLRKNPGASIINGCDTLFLNIQDLISHT
jgi:hypothetical protein